MSMREGRMQGGRQEGGADALLDSGSMRKDSTRSSYIDENRLTTDIPTLVPNRQI